jgi:hypothetical protein
VVGGVRVGREIRAFEGVEISDGREKRGKEVSQGGGSGRPR